MRLVGEFVSKELRTEIEDQLDKLPIGGIHQVLVDSHNFVTLKTRIDGVNTGRHRFLVACDTCRELVHQATTGPVENMEHHLAHREHNPREVDPKLAEAYAIGQARADVLELRDRLVDVTVECFKSKTILVAGQYVAIEDGAKAPGLRADQATAHELIANLDSQIRSLQAANEYLRERGEPIPMRINCPDCGHLHIDEGAFATKPHHTHSCQFCGLTWRPAVASTVGVQFLPGFKNP